MLQLRRARSNPILKLGIEPLQLPGLAIEFGEHPDLGAQHFRNYRYRNVVHRAHFVAAKPVYIADLNGRDEDHRRLLEARVLADHGGELEPVQFRHANVDQNDGNLVLQKIFERIPAGGSDNEILAKLL